MQTVETPDLITEKVRENYRPWPGGMATRTFWICYPAHVAHYGHASDRISRALGTGQTRKAALAAAQSRRKGADGGNA